MQLDLLVVLSVTHWLYIPTFNLLTVCKSDLQSSLEGIFYLATLQGSGGDGLVALGISVQS